MGQPLAAVTEYGKLTLQAQGDPDDTGTFTIARSSQPFKNLQVMVNCITAAKFKLKIYFNGEKISDKDNSGSGKVVDYVNYYAAGIFPPSVGLDANPRAVSSGVVPAGIVITAEIENFESEARVFEVYSCYELLDFGSFVLL